MIPVPWKLWEGQVVDQCFPLHRYLGGPERSAVYLTQFGDPQPRNAAIKLIVVDNPVNDPASSWERAAQLSHPYLLPLLRTGSWEMNQLSLRYAVTEYAEENLADVLAERALTPAEVRAMLAPLVDAVTYIHAEGMVHGHLKPANILAMGDDLKLSVDGASLVGEPGAALWAPGPYDPPEFAERGCSPVGDVWSLGVTIVEALTRRLPTMRGPKDEPILPPGVPPEFLAMVRACLRPDPRRRASLQEILALYGREEPKPAPVAVSAPEPPVASRKWLNWSMVGAATLVLAGILAWPRISRAPAPASASPVTSAPAPPEAPVAAAPEPVPAAVTPPPPAPAPARERPRAVVDAAPGQVVHQVMPEIPEYARRTIRGKVKIDVRATVDDSGRVTDASVEAQNSKYFAKLSQEAARHWQFAPRAGEWLLRFEFTTAATAVHPSFAAK